MMCSFYGSRFCCFTLRSIIPYISWASSFGFFTRDSSGLDQNDQKAHAKIKKNPPKSALKKQTPPSTAVGLNPIPANLEPHPRLAVSAAPPDRFGRGVDPREQPGDATAQPEDHPPAHARDALPPGQPALKGRARPSDRRPPGPPAPADRARGLATRPGASQRRRRVIGIRALHQGHR